MAVVFEGFSIREYASKMRSVDIAKCWPFAADITTEAVETLLPPVTITKFRWWSHELHLLGSTTTQHPPVSDTKSRENDEETMDMGHERRRMKMAAKAKCRAPKKRSIVEIFAVAPQIHNLVVDDDLEEDSAPEEEETPGAGDGSIGVLMLKSNIDKKKKKANKKMKIKKVVVDKLMKKKKKKMQKKLKKKTNCKERSTLKKDIPCHLKKQNQVNFAKKPNGSAHASGIIEGAFNAVANDKKTALPCLATQRKDKVVQSSKVLKQEFPVRSILKSKRKVLSGESTATCNIQTVSKVKSFSIQNSDKHVRFFDQNDMLGTRKKTISSEHGFCNLHSDALAPLSRKDQFTHSDKNIVTTIESESDHDDNSIGPENENRVQTMTGKEKLPDAGDHYEIPYFVRPHFSCQEQRRHLSNKSPSQVVMCNDNLDMADHSNGAASCNDSYALYPRRLSTTKGVRSPPVNSQICGHVSQSSSSSGKLIDCCDDRTHRVPALSSKENTWAFRQLTSSGFACNGIPNSRVPFSSKAATENLSTTLMQYEPFCCRSSMDVMGSLFPVPEWKERAVTFREKNMEEGFLGLPLNSQGELVQTNSFLIRGFNQLEYSGLTTGSSSSLPGCGSLLPRSVEDFSNSKGKHFVERAVPEDQLNLFPVHNCRKEKPTVYLPARLGVNEELTEKAGADFVNYETRNSHFCCSLDPKPNQMNNSFDAVRLHDQVQNQNGNGMIQSRENSDYMFLNNSQPTMRLMGKDVAVGRSSTEIKQCDAGKVMTDNEILAGHQPIHSDTNNSSLKVHFPQDWLLHPVLGKSKENPTHEAVQSNTFIKAAEAKIPRFLSSHPKWQTFAVFQNGSPIDNVNPGSRFHHVGPSLNSPAILNRVLEPVASGAETLRNNSQLPMLSATQNVCHHMNYPPAELRYKQNLPHASKSSFNFPFLHPDSGEHVQPLLVQSSSNSLIPWLLHATQQVKTNISPQPFLDVVGKDHPQTSRVNFLTTPSTHHSPVISYPPNSTTSHSYMEGPLGPASMNHSPHLSASLGIKPNSSVSLSNRNRNKVRRRMKSKGFGVKCADRCHKTSKRPATTEDNSSKPTKIPHLGMEDDLGSATGLGIQIRSSSTQYGAGSGRDKSSEQHNQSQFQSDELSTLPEVELTKVDGIRYGSIKLSAGTKHILKPSQNTDQDNSRLIHSTIPSISMMDCGGFIETQKKPTKIYRF